MAIIASAICVHVNNAKPAQEKKPQEKAAPAPKKAAEIGVHQNDAFYNMAFGRKLPKNTFVAAARQPVSQKGQPHCQ